MHATVACCTWMRVTTFNKGQIPMHPVKPIPEFGILWHNCYTAMLHRCRCISRSIFWARDPLTHNAQAASLANEIHIHSCPGIKACCCVTMTCETLFTMIDVMHTTTLHEWPSLSWLNSIKHLPKVDSCPLCRRSAIANPATVPNFYLSNPKLTQTSL